MSNTKGNLNVVDAYAAQQADIARDLLRVRGELIAHTALANASEDIGEMLIHDLQQKAGGVESPEFDVLDADKTRLSWSLAKIADRNVEIDTDDELRLSARSIKRAGEMAKAGVGMEETARNFIPEVAPARSEAEPVRPWTAGNRAAQK